MLPSDRMTRKEGIKMNKNIWVYLTTGALIASTLGASVGCAKKSTAVTETIVSAAAIQNTEIDTILQADEVPEIVMPEAVHHLQNPVMNFIGNYHNNKTTLKVEAVSLDDALITIVLSEGENTKTVFKAYSRFNSLTNSIAYGNGKKQVLTLDKDGKTVSEKEIYSDGLGVFVVDNSTVT